jgi:hypothetical protein
MMPRRSITRKYRPLLEPLEPKQLLSVSPTISGSETPVRVPSPVLSQVQHATICPCGTGKGIRIGTS